MPVLVGANAPALSPGIAERAGAIRRNCRHTYLIVVNMPASIW